MSVNEVAVESRIASAMGAKISISGPGRCMYLIIGNGTSFEPIVRSAGGEIALRLNGRKILASLPFSGYLSLKGNRQISHIGPVSVDLNRLAAVSKMLSGAVGPGSNGSV